MPAFSESFVTTLSYPRTGKRGVPQQFPRRLFEMLESESRYAALSSDHPRTISWSPSGKAFGIHNVGLFTAQVLPKYFRTSKFSSFQRNLNLYGFAKVRRGPDADMYAHPSFLRGHPQLLAQLRKCKTVAGRMRSSSSSSSSGSDSEDSSSSGPLTKEQVPSRYTPTPITPSITISQVSPSPPNRHHFLQVPPQRVAETRTITGTNRLALLATVLESSAPLAIKQPV